MSFELLDAAFDGDVESITIKRLGEAIYEKGVAVKQCADYLNIVANANVQPLGQKEAEQLDKEFTRDKIYKIFYTETKVLVTDSIVYSGADFDILNVADWLKHGGFCEVSAVAINRL
jgi:hypothetical protein